jgi:chromosome segregation ATPase
LREENLKLDPNVARVKDALDAALAEGKKIREEAARKLDPAKNEIEQLRAELSSRGEELEAARKEAAGAHEARMLAEVRMAALEAAVERYRADAEERQAELAQAKEQLDQAAGVAVAAERARQAAIRGAEILRSEAERAREELTAAKEESANLKAATAIPERSLLPCRWIRGRRPRQRNSTWP